MESSNERTDGSLSLRNYTELNDAATLGASALEQNFSKLNLTGRFKELDQVFVGSRPGQLYRDWSVKEAAAYGAKLTLRTMIC